MRRVSLLIKLLLPLSLFLNFLSSRPSVHGITRCLHDFRDHLARGKWAVLAGHVFSAFLVALSSMFWRLVFSKLGENRLRAIFCQFQYFKAFLSHFLSQICHFILPTLFKSRHIFVNVRLILLSALPITQLILKLTADINLFNTWYFQLLEKPPKILPLWIFSSSTSNPLAVNWRNDKFLREKDLTCVNRDGVEEDDCQLKELTSVSWDWI